MTINQGKYDNPGVITKGDLDESGHELTSLMSMHEKRLQRAYKLGVLHGINAQSMAQVKNDVMEFDDYGWEMNE